MNFTQAKNPTQKKLSHLELTHISCRTFSIQFTVAPTEKARRKQNQTKYKISAESLYVDLVERWFR